MIPQSEFDDYANQRSQVRTALHRDSRAGLIFLMSMAALIAIAGNDPDHVRMRATLGLPLTVLFNLSALVSLALLGWGLGMRWHLKEPGLWEKKRS